jgi:hypothetical protein
MLLMTVPLQRKVGAQSSVERSHALLLTAAE